MVVLPVAVICVLGVIRREQLITAPTDLQRRALERMARVPKPVQAALAGYMLIGFAAIYALLQGGPRLAALVAQVVGVFLASTWVRSIFNRDEPPSGSLAAVVEPAADPTAATSQPPPSLG